MYIDRKITALLSKVKKSILILGPRQTGKSTLIKTLAPELSINLADESLFVSYLSDPGLIKKTAKSYRKIFIDEVQRIPSILNTVQSMLDEDPSRQFFLTGSSARKLKRGQANLLPGRLLVYELGPFSFSEIKKQWEVEKALKVGLLPGIYLEPSLSTAEKTLKSYATTYLKEEIQAEALTRNLEGFSRFFQVIVSQSGNLIDFSKISSLASIERTSARRYYDILIDTLIVSELSPFTRSQKRRLIQHPRFYFFDVGVLNGALDNFSVSGDRIGSLFEHLILQLILSGAKAHDDTVRMSNYRTNAGVEVDFILERKNELFAIEVKASKKITSSDLRGLKSFIDFYGKKCRPLVIYLGEHALSMDGIDILPTPEAMKLLGY
ncbi:MAG: ATP-binding protein [Deltaproteobacteria bacterium]|nr:ATP-binding protein [Deltaproteobacteria bacterium]